MDSFETSLAPDEANDFLDALMDPDYRARLADPDQRQAALAEHGIDVSDDFAAGMAELPDTDVIQAITSGEGDIIAASKQLPGCRGLALALVVASMAQPPTSKREAPASR